MQLKNDCSGMIKIYIVSNIYKLIKFQHWITHEGLICCWINQTKTDLTIKCLVFTCYFSSKNIWSILKNIEPNVYLLKLKWTMNVTLVFFKIVLVAFKILIPINFSLFGAPLLIWGDAASSYFFLLSSISPNLTLKMDFQSRKQE